MIEMNQVPTKNKSMDSDQRQFEIELITTGTSDWVRIPVGINRLVLSLYPDVGATGKIQTTNDTLENIELGSEVAENWPAGDVSVVTTDAAIPVKAFRAIASVGQIRVVGTGQ